MTEPPPLSAAREPLAATYDVALVDLDGVVYRGPEPVEYAPRSLAAAVQLGLRIAFVTNNALRRPEQVADHLTALGVPATGDDVVTSAQACIALLATAAPGFRRVLVLGGDGLDSAVLEAGATVVRSYDDNPDAVVQGLKPTLTYADLGEACLALRAGVPWVAANLDSTLPTPRGELPGTGAIVAALERATGRRPLVAGKPEPALHREAARRTASARPLVVGDRLDSDVAGAIAAGYPSLLVLTGVSTAADLLVATPDERPTYIAADLRGLLRRHRGVALDGLTARCGGARAGWVDGRVAVSVGPDEAPDEADGLDPLRVAAAVSWAASAAGHEPYWDDAHVAALLEPPTGANAAASGR